MDSSNIFDNASLKDGFAGDRRFLKGFLAKIELVFILYPERYQDEESKVIYLISRLYGKAMNWAATLIEQNDPCLHNYGEFKDKLKSFYAVLTSLILPTKCFVPLNNNTSAAFADTYWNSTNMQTSQLGMKRPKWTPS